MSTPDSQSYSKACDIILRHGLDRASASVTLEPKGDSYVVSTVNGDDVEEIMAPPAHLSMGLFVQFCQRAEISRDASSGSFAFEHQGRSHRIEMHIVPRPEGTGAVLILS